MIDILTFNDITIKTERRPCFVNGKKAIWHKWVERGEVLNGYSLRESFALVEYEDGSVKEEYPQDVKFADGGDFKQFAWIENE